MTLPGGLERLEVRRVLIGHVLVVLLTRDIGVVKFPVYWRTLNVRISFS
jgi:hypothetical protein